jgi:hypothetical protein
MFSHREKEPAALHVINKIHISGPDVKGESTVLVSRPEICHSSYNATCG